MKIKLNPDNPRQINETKFKKLKQSIQEFPKMLELRPIVVDKEGIILGGNMRYRALQDLGMEIRDEWVKVADKLTDEERRRFIVEDNLEFGEFDWDSLSTQYDAEELMAWGMDEKDLQIEKEVVEDEVPEVSDEPPVSKLGEVYQLGKHRIMCADSTVKSNVEKLMDGKKADMVFTDPPYGMDLDTDFSKMTSANSFASGKKHTRVIGDDKQFDATFLIDMADEVLLFGADYYVDTLPNYGKDGSWMIWDKRAGESQDKGFGSNFEMLWSKVKHKRWLLRQTWFGFFTGGEKREYEHPTCKPVKLLAEVMDKIKAPDVILDLFLGSGSTLIACEQTNRICYGMEIDEKYCDVIRKRYAKFIGKEDQWQTITPVI